MKFWELTSAFRSETYILLKVLKQTKWKKYYKQYLRLREIVKNQEREILDSELPFDLCYEVADKSKQEYWLSYKEEPQLLYNYRPNIGDFERLLPSEILIRFGGDKIEQAHEYCMVNVQPKALLNNVEVIGSYVFKNGELLSILRAKQNTVIDNCLLSTPDDAKRWKVMLERKDIFVSPYSAHEKIAAQKEQNIRQYYLIGIDHRDRPVPGEILNLIG